MQPSFDYQALFSLLKNQSNAVKSKKSGSTNLNFRQLFLRFFKQKRTGTISKVDKYSETNHLAVEEVTGKYSDSKVNYQSNADYFDMLAFQMFKEVQSQLPSNLNYGVINKQIIEDENENIEVSVRNGESSKIYHEESTSKDVIKEISDKLSSQLMDIPPVKNYVLKLSPSSTNLEKPNSLTSLKSQELDDQNSYWLDATHIERDITVNNETIEINLLPLLDQMDIFGDIIRMFLSHMSRIQINAAKLDRKGLKGITNNYKNNKDQVEKWENYENRFKFQNTESISNFSLQQGGLTSDSREKLDPQQTETIISGPYRNLEHENSATVPKPVLLSPIRSDIERNKVIVVKSSHEFSEYIKTDMKQLSRIIVKELFNAFIKNIVLDLLERYNVISTNKNVFFVETGPYSNLKKLNDKKINSNFLKLTGNKRNFQGKPLNFKKESSASVSNYSLFQNDDRVYECRLECDESLAKQHGRSLYKLESIKNGISSEGQRSIYEVSALTRNRYSSIPSKLGVTDYDLIYNPVIRNIDRNNTYGSVSTRMSEAISREYLKRNAKYMRHVGKTSYNTEFDFKRSYENENANISSLNFSNDSLFSNSYASENFDSKIQKILENIYGEIIGHQRAKNKSRLSEKIQDQSDVMTSVKPLRNFSSYSPDLSRVESVDFLVIKLKSRQITTVCSSDNEVNLNCLKEIDAESNDLNCFCDDTHSQNAKFQEIFFDESLLNDPVSLCVLEAPVKKDENRPSFDALLPFNKCEIQYMPDSSKIRKTTIVYNSKKTTN